MRWHELIPPADGIAWVGIFSGAFLAFYAFIGFEDMVNVAEEVKDASHTLPRAIILALIVSTVLYLSVALVAVMALPIRELAASEAPLAVIMNAHGKHYGLLISGISLVAVINGALIQIIMVSRVLYGMGHAGLAWTGFSRVNPRTRTPLRATLLVTLVILIMALWLHLETLAGMTSVITLLVFSAINLALIKLKRREPALAGITQYPIWVPLCGCTLSLLLLIVQSTHLLD